MAQVSLNNVQKTYPDGNKVVHGINLDIADGEFIVLVGPSGCGKSTTLRMVAGLEEISAGAISIDGRAINDVHPKDRDIAMVFQNYALYPHMSVRENIAFALKLRRVPKADIERRVQAAAASLGLEPLLARKPKELSGGQRQRVAVGRAIVREPKVFLFDEPLSNLDARLRVTTRAELKALQLRLRTTTIYVTHDQEEAMTLGDRVVVMYKGVVQQAGAPLDVYRRPLNRFVAGFLGTPPMNFIEGSLATDPSDASNPDAVVFVENASTPGATGARMKLPTSTHASLRPHVGKPVALGIRPQMFSDARGPASAAHNPADPTLTFTTRLCEPLGDAMDVSGVTPAGTPLVARLVAHDLIPPGTTLTLRIDPANLAAFEPGDTGRNLLAT
jgi:multiple sugar transport system ATP-binding protein